MATIHKLTKDGATIFPATITDAVVHQDTGKTLTSMIKEYNVSELFPTEGIAGGNTYNLALAVQVLGTHLRASEKTGGIKLTFISSVFGSPVEEYYLGKNTWSAVASDWKQRFEVGDVVADPAGDWDPSSAETYIDSQIAIVTSDLASETLARQAGDAEAVKTVTQTLSTAQKDIANANLKNKDALNGMGRVVLKATDDFKTVIEGQTGGNTIFVIRYDFTLSSNVTIPSNCVLEFDGGSLSGAYTITGQNTDIVANSNKILSTTITLAGTWKCIINICWFGLSAINEDNSSIINNLHIPSGLSAFIPNGTYAFKSSIELPYFSSFKFYGNLVYTGTTTNIKFIRMNGFGTYEFLGYIACESPSINYTDANNSNIIGLEVYNAKCCKFTIANIYGFNENIRISAYGNIGEGGSAWNSWYILENRKANKHIRIWQEDVDGHMGWVNGQYFYTQRMPVDADVYAAGKVTLFHINGEYPNGHVATNKCDEMYFNCGTAEVDVRNNVVPIYIENAQYVRFNNIRHEGATKLAKIVGACYNLVFNIGYGKSETSGNWFDLSECTTQPFDSDFLVKNFVGEISLIDKDVVTDEITSGWYGFLTVRDAPKSTVKIVSNANGDIEFDSTINGGQDMPCMFVDSTNNKLFYIENMGTSINGDIYISYARNSNGELISKDGNDAYSNDKVKVGERYLTSFYSPSSSAGTHGVSDNQLWKIARRTSFRIPDDITGFYISISKGFNRFRLYSLATNPYTQFEPKVLKRLV